jgi:hypothetical protein
MLIVPVSLASTVSVFLFLSRQLASNHASLAGAPYMRLVIGTVGFFGFFHRDFQKRRG